MSQGISDLAVEAGLFLRAINRKAAKEKIKEDIFADESDFPKIVTAKQNIAAIEGACTIGFFDATHIPCGTQASSMHTGARLGAY